jgi:quinol monooxygenase YgiN
MILTTVRIALSDQNLSEALSILKSVAELSKTQCGCLDCRVYRDATNVNVIMFEGKWTNEEELAEYLRSDEYRKVLIVMESALEKPEIRFDTVLSSAGLETVEKARKPG